MGAAGAGVHAAVLKVFGNQETATSNSTSNSTRALLGEDGGGGSASAGEGGGTENTPAHEEAQQTLGHQACQTLWQQVEALCQKVDHSSEHGLEAVKSNAEAEAKAFIERL